ncbi:MAG: hypothetical protein GC145_05635 [Caulobacter sp.]|nr:hypothetical protein [Caulobacter sp.]
MSVMTFDRPEKPPLRTLAVLIAAIVAVAAAPVLSLTGTLTAEAFASSGDETLRAAPYAFSIWGLIYLALFSYAVWQMLRQTPETPALRAMAWPSVVAMSGCALWLLAAGLDMKAATVIIIVGSAAAAIHGLFKAIPHIKDLGRASSFFIFWPMGLLAGWLTIASAINILTVLTAWGVITPALALPAALIGIAAVLAVGSAVVWRLGRMTYGLPIAWGLVAVFVAELAGKPLVAWAALLAALAMLAISVYAGLPRKRR